MAEPQLILIPGAWHTPSGFEPLTTRLKALGYTTHCRQLASVGNPNPTSDLSADIAIVRSLVETAIGDLGNDVVVLAHSWGGIIASSALVGLGKKERADYGKKGGVIRCGYIAASILPPGVSLMDSLGHTFPSWCDIKEPYIYALDPKIFYSDLPEDEQRYWFERMERQLLDSFYAITTGAAWKQIPSGYLVCEEDQCLPVQGQDAMINAVRQAGGNIEVTRLKSGHSPFLSKIEETVGWVRRVAGEVVEMSDG